MAKNEIFEEGDSLSLVCTQPTTPASGDPVLCGQIPGVAQTAERADGTTSVKTRGVWSLPVEGKDAANANTTVAVGDIVYYDSANTVKLNKDNTNGVRFGYVVGNPGQTGTIISSGATGTVRVKVGY